MKNNLIKTLASLSLASLIAILPLFNGSAWAAAGIFPSGGGSKVVGQSFTVSIKASGAEFDSLQGTISVTGSVSVSVSAGSATWLPGKSPSNGGQFVGIVNPTSSLTVATLTLKGTKEGSGKVTVSGVSLARNGSYVGTAGGSVSFTVGRAPTPPGQVSVSSTTHPDQETAYEATTVALQWTAPSNGATGYSYTLDETADTTPATTVNTTETSLTLDNITVGVHYFHIRALNSDGWGETTHFKIVIKEPDAKVDTTLSAPTITSVEKTANFQTDLEKGTVSGIVVRGTGGQSGYVTNLIFDPKDRLPVELFQAADTTSDQKVETETGAVTSETPASTTSLTPLQVAPNPDGSWEISFTYPIPSGFYKLVAQNQKDKVLSPESSASYLEVSVANGGTVKFITDKDAAKKGLEILGVTFKSASQFWFIVSGILILLIALAFAGIYFLWWRRHRKSR